MATARFQVQPVPLGGRNKGSERYVKQINKSGWIVIELHGAVQLLAERLHHAGAEAAPCRMLNRRAAPFSPGQAHPLFLFVDCPGDFDAAVGIREGAKFGGVGAKLVEASSRAR